MKNLELLKEEPIKVGEVYLEQDIIISDPCYEKYTYDTVELSLPFQGMYDCYFTKHDEIVASIFVVLANETSAVLGAKIATCGVDSGQLGIFNISSYRKGVFKEDFEETLKRKFPYESWKRKWEDTKDDEDTFYKACCNITLSDDEVGIIRNVGFVSRSGCGDGAYPVYRLLNENNDTVGFRIDFIDLEGED